MALQFTLLFISLIFLFIGAELALDASEKVGKALRLSPLVVGLFLIGFGTSLPEFFVSQIAAFQGVHNIALGNVIGSNIGNIFLIMGVTGMMAKLSLEGKELKHQMYMHLLVTGLLGVFFIWIKKINWLSSLVFIIFFLAFMYISYKGMAGHKEKVKDQPRLELGLSGWFILVTKLLSGFALLYFSGNLLVSSGKEICKFFNISEYIISAILIALGTSFPELVTSVMACIRKKDLDMITGNIIGSNIFNIAFVLGSLGGFNIEIARNFVLEMSLLVGAAVFFVIGNKTRMQFKLPQGLTFLGVYGGIVLYWVTQLKG